MKLLTPDVVYTAAERILEANPLTGADRIAV
jgi:hypothetical protein